MYFISKIKLGKTIKLLIGLALGFGRDWVEGSMSGGRRQQICYIRIQIWVWKLVSLDPAGVLGTDMVAT